MSLQSNAEEFNFQPGSNGVVKGNGRGRVFLRGRAGRGKKGGVRRGGQGSKSAGWGGAWVRQIVPKVVPPLNPLLGTFRTFFSKEIVFKAQNASFGK